ncbi:hypothetical protein H5410_036808, partial [Solanum commersonii]
MKWSSQRVADQFREAEPYRPTTQNAKRLKAKRGRKTKTTKLIVDGIGLTWVQLERVNPSPSPTHSARESDGLRQRLCLMRQLDVREKPSWFGLLINTNPH